MAKNTNANTDWQNLDEVVDELPASKRGRNVDPAVLARAQAAIADRKPRRVLSPEDESAEDYAKRATSVIGTLRRIVTELDPSLTVSQRQHGGWLYWQVKAGK
jgi:hypothetical protein